MSENNFDIRNKISKSAKNKKIKTVKDIDKKIKNEELADVGKIISNGNYYWYYKVPFWYKILWFIDGLFTGLLYLMTSIVLSWAVDQYLVRSLNTSDSKIFIFRTFTDF